MNKLPLRGRLALLTAVAVAIAVAAVAVASWFTVRTQLYQKLDDRLQAQAGPPGGGDMNKTGGYFFDRIISSMEKCHTTVSDDQTDDPFQGVAYQQVLKLDGTRCAMLQPSRQQDNKTYAITFSVAPDDVAVANGERRDSLHNGVASDGTSVRIYTRSLPGTGAVSYAVNLDEVEGPLHSLGLLLITISLLGVVGAALAGLLTARAALKPVDTLTEAVEDIARTEDLSVKIPEEGTDEIARLGRSFNAMTSALAASQERQRNLIADAGHELRTPLTSMKTNIELLMRSEATGRELAPDVKARLLTSVKLQMQELTTLIGDLLQLGSPAAKKREITEVPLHDVARRAVERARLRGPGLTVTAWLDPWYVKGDADTLERAVVNLCDNAVKFSPSGGTVEVRLERGVLTVRDQGPGIPDDELPYVFERFWRSPSARSLPGSGLGLSIVAQIAEETGGRVALLPAPGGGTLARLELPGTRTAT